MKKLLYIIILLSGLKMSAQVNLVPNPSFEDTLICGPGNPVQNWTMIYGSPDYFNEIMTACSFANNGFNNIFGYQEALDSTAYMGFSTWCPTPTCMPENREAVQVQLGSALFPFKKYCLSFYVNLAANCQHATDDIQAYFSNTSSISYPAPAQVSNPSGNFITDTVSWTLISDVYTAGGGEQYLNIGNFKNDAFTTVITHNTGAPIPGTYYFIDVVSLVQLPDINAGVDQTILLGDSTQLSAFCVGCWPGLEYHWIPANGLTDTTILDPWAKPTVTTTYYFGLTDTSGTIVCMDDYVDSVTVYVSGVGVDENKNSKFKIQIRPNPTNGFAYYETELGRDEKGKIEFYDLVGNLVFNKEFNSGINKGTLDLSDLSGGIYIYKVIINDELRSSNKLVITK